MTSEEDASNVKGASHSSLSQCEEKTQSSVSQAPHMYKSPPKKLNKVKGSTANRYFASSPRIFDK
tara:strand:- start:143 stop:337 length:195 start_codon:yes stop_codon:yes gene_type:complete